MTETPIPKIQRKLLIESLFKSHGKFKKSIISSPVQASPFRLGFRIVNQDTKNFPGGTIKNIIIKSSESKDLTEPFTEEFDIPNLNPKEQYIIWIPDATTTYLSGLIWISFSITPKDEHDEIVTYQIYKKTGRVCKFKLNYWGDAYYIIPKYEREQGITNSLIICLTIITTLQGIFGLKEIIYWVFQNIGSIFLFIGKWLSQTGK